MKTFANFFIFAIAAMTLVAFEVQEVSAKGGPIGAHNSGNNGFTGKPHATPGPKGMAGSALPKKPTIASRPRSRMAKRRVDTDAQTSMLIKRQAHNAGGAPP